MSIAEIDGRIDLRGRLARVPATLWVGVAVYLLLLVRANDLLNDGDTTLGGRVPVNTSGGLACFGEAVPAQALAQVCEITWQLRGQAGARQSEGASVGITANKGLFGHGSSVLLTK